MLHSDFFSTHFWRLNCSLEGTFNGGNDQGRTITFSFLPWRFFMLPKQPLAHLYEPAKLNEMWKNTGAPAATHPSGPGFWLRSLSAWWPWCRSWRCGGCWCLWRWSRCASCCHSAACWSCLWSGGLRSPSRTRSADNWDGRRWRRERVKKWNELRENWSEKVLVRFSCVRARLSETAAVAGGVKELSGVRKRFLGCAEQNFQTLWFTGNLGFTRWL